MEDGRRGFAEAAAVWRSTNKQLTSRYWPELYQSRPGADSRFSYYNPAPLTKGRFNFNGHLCKIFLAPHNRSCDEEQGDDTVARRVGLPCLWRRARSGGWFGFEPSILFIEGSSCIRS